MIPVAIILQPAMQTQLSFLTLFVDAILHLSELLTFLGFFIGALLVEVFIDWSGGGLLRAALRTRTTH